jgi:hypothetical protein
LAAPRTRTRLLLLHIRSLALVPLLVVAAGRTLAAQSPTGSGALGRVNASAVGDFVADLSPDGATRTDSSRFALRGLEVAAWSRLRERLLVRGVLLVDESGRVNVLEAFGAVRGLPLGLDARAGRMLVPFGMLNEVHVHALPTVEHALPLQVYLDESGATASGLEVSRGFGGRTLATTVTLAAVDHVLDDSSALRGIDRPNRLITGVGYVGRLHTAWRPTADARFAVAASALTSRRLQPLTATVIANGQRVNAVVARQTLVGVEARFERTRLSDAMATSDGDGEPSLLVHALVARQVNERESSLQRRIPLDPLSGGPFYAGPSRDGTGASLLARVRVRPAWHVAARADRAELTARAQGITSAYSGYLQYLPRELGRAALGYELRERDGSTDHRVLVQLQLAVGRHPAADPRAF